MMILRQNTEFFTNLSEKNFGFICIPDRSNGIIAIVGSTSTLISAYFQDIYWSFVKLLWNVKTYFWCYCQLKQQYGPFCNFLISDHIWYNGLRKQQDEIVILYSILGKKKAVSGKCNEWNSWLGRSAGRVPENTAIVLLEPYSSSEEQYFHFFTCSEKEMIWVRRCFPLWGAVVIYDLTLGPEANCQWCAGISILVPSWLFWFTSNPCTRN